MHPYLWIPLSAVLVSALTSGIILARDSTSQANRILATLGLANAFWGMCEVAWNTTSDPAEVLRLVRLSALGWIWIGPISLHLFLAVAESTERWKQDLLALAYGLAAVMLLLEWTTPWMHEGVVAVGWGWAYVPGPLFSVYYGLTLVAFGCGLWTAVRAFRRYASPSERRQSRVVLAALLVPVFFASLTDGVLPILGIQLPRVGTLAISSLGAAVAWSYFRFGYSLLAPGRFAPEILDSLAVGVMLVRQDGCIRIVNRGMAQLLGREQAELRGEPVGLHLPFVPGAGAQPVDDLEGNLLAADGSRVPVAVSTAPLQDAQGVPVGSVLVVRDLREVVALRDRLVTSGRMAAVGQLAAGIAHEINNPIAYVRSNLGVLRAYWDAVRKEMQALSPGELPDVFVEGEELIEESLQGVDRAASIIRDVNGFSHAGSAERDAVDLVPLLERALRVAAPQLKGRARLETDFAEVPPVPCAPQEVQQVFLNLILNAGQAVDVGGLIRVTTRPGPGSVVVGIADDGCGIPPEHLERVFDPFFTTKPVGEGTGLGLSISYQIVRKHGGEIRVESEPGRGTVFHVHLPVA